MMFAEDQSAFVHFKVPANAAYAVLSCMDSMFLLRRELSALMTTDVAKRKVFGEKGSCELGSLSDLNHNAILDRGSIVGLWEYDSDQNAIAWRTFLPADKSLPEIIARTEGYIREQLGDARSFSLDSPKSRAPRVAAIRAAGKR